VSSKTIFAFAAAGLLCAAIAHAQYPNRPVRIVVPSSAGGGTDIIARIVAPRLSERLGQQIVIDNRPGAGTMIGGEVVAKAPPDGYTVGYAIGSALTMNPTLYAKLPYDPVKDFVPVSVIANVPLALVVHPSVDSKTAKELADYIKANPGKLFYGQANIVAKVATEAFSAAAGGKMVEVPYKGSTPNVQDLVLGRVQVSIEPVATVLPHVQAGKLRALAVTDGRRSKAFPDLPTVAETGVPGYAFNNWHAILLPAGTPKEIVAKLNEEIVKAARHPDVAAKVAPLGVEMVGSTPEELQKRANTEREHWAKQIKALNIKAE